MSLDDQPALLVARSWLYLVIFEGVPVLGSVSNQLRKRVRRTKYVARLEDSAYLVALLKCTWPFPIRTIVNYDGNPINRGKLFRPGPADLLKSLLEPS